ncbi:MAG: hypothetical protein GKS00_09270 [Alphaproteobacteria bacterium]|nr:hypothetical protein [Alphaproteobacteria bacterium]
MQDTQVTKPTGRGPDWTGLLILALIWAGIAGYFFYVAVLVLYPPDEFLEGMYSDFSPEERDAIRLRVHVFCYGIITGTFTATVAPLLLLLYKYKNRTR